MFKVTMALLLVATIQKAKSDAHFEVVVRHGQQLTIPEIHYVAQIRSEPIEQLATLYYSRLPPPVLKYLRDVYEEEFEDALSFVQDSIIDAQDVVIPLHLDLKEEEAS